MYNKLMKITSRLAACLLVLAIIFGTGLYSGNISEVTASAADEVIFPSQAAAAEKPYINIVTNIVVDATGAPTGYVELALVVKTPKTGDTDSDYQTTFRNLAVTLEYNNELLIPVSWEHTIKTDADGKILNAYPDFVDSYNDIDLETATEEQILTRADEVNAMFESAVPYSIPMASLQHDTAIEGDIAFVGGPKPLLSFSTDSNTDLVLTEETPLAVVRFLYTGTDLKSVIDNGIVNTDKITSGHDERGNTAGAELKSLFWFADDADLEYVIAGQTISSPTNQALYYTAGDYVGQNFGATAFYATKNIYNGTEIDAANRPDNIGWYDGVTVTTKNYTESTTLKNANGTNLERPMTGTTDESNYDFDYDRRVVKAISKTAAPGTDGYYSYTSNLLFSSTSSTSKLAEEYYDKNCNIRFGVVAQESYRSTGGVDMANIATVVFLDWDDTILGALAITKGDARSAVNNYVENFIHPTLRASAYADDLDMLENVTTSLERQYTYAGKYPNTVKRVVDASGAVQYNPDGSVMKTGDTVNDGVTTFPDGYSETDPTTQIEIDLSGSSYPLTNKLDYAFLRRPVIKLSTATYLEGTSDAAAWPYLDANDEPTSAVEWTTGVVDWKGETDDLNDDYPYIHGWAIVADPSESDSVWTTFSGAGELDGKRLPGYDTDNDNDGSDNFNNNKIRAANTDVGVSGSQGGAVSIDGSTEISFATYGASAGFEFADFSNVETEEDAIFVKACYEPAEEIDWVLNYTVASEPYYVRTSLLASEDKGNSYLISFDYERITEDGFGVLRTRDPQARISFLDDASNATDGFITGENTPEVLPVENIDVTTVEFYAASKFYSVQYALVEVFGSESAQLGVNRSIDANEAGILTNFNYLADDEGGTISGNWQNGFEYENRQGTKGFILEATLRQVLERGTEAAAEIKRISEGSSSNKDALISAAKNNFYRYLSQNTLMDFNFRLDTGNLPNGTSAAANNARTRAQQAIYDAIDIAYNAGELDDTGVVKLEWHQLQFHIMNWSGASGTQTVPGGIAVPGNSGGNIRQPDDCKPFEWCRLDECGDKVVINNLAQALEAVYLAYNSSGAVADSAREALSESLILTLTNNKDSAGDPAYILRSDGGKSTREEAKVSGAYTDAEWETVAASLKALIDKVANDGADYTALTAKQVQHWLGSNGTSYSDPDNGAIAPDNPKYDYWWLYSEIKPYAVDFTSNDVDVLTDKMIEAVVSALDGNELAWYNLDASVIERMRFRSSARGDFFDSATNQPGDYASYMSNTHDSRTTLVLADYANVDAFVAAVTSLINDCGYASVGETWATLDAELTDIKRTLSKDITSDYAWYQIQHYLLKGTMTNYPAIYAGNATNWSEEYSGGAYWWKYKDMRLEANTTTDSSIYPYAGASLDDLRSWLEGYTATNNRDEYEDKFLIWFTPEVAADLIIKSNGSSATAKKWTPIVITSDTAASNVAQMLLELSGKHSSDFDNLWWSQIQYYVARYYHLNENERYSSLKGAQGFTFDESVCSWGYITTGAGGASTTVGNRWRSLETYVQSINDLEDLVQVISDYAYGENLSALEAVESLDDFEFSGLDFRADEADVDDKFQHLDATALRLELDEMVDAFDTASSATPDTTDNDGWKALIDMVGDANTVTLAPRDVWYVIQYYLYNGEFLGSGSVNAVVEATATAAKLQYWWEYNWSGPADYISFYSASICGVPAKIYWMTNTGTYTPQGGVEVDYGKSNTANFATTTQHLRGIANTELNWDTRAFRDALFEISDVSLENSTAWWQYLQFLILHADQEDSEAYHTMAESTFKAEANKFYWWYSDGATPGTPRTLSLPSSGSPNHVNETVAATYRNNAAKVIAEAALYKFATGTTINDSLFSAQSIIDNLNIRDAASDNDTVTVRDPDASDPSKVALARYTDEQALAKLKSLVEHIYETNAPPATAGWDYLSTYAVDGTSIYTYYQNAYDEVCTLTPLQLQHWFATGELLDMSDSTMVAELEAKYWWISQATKPAGGDVAIDTLREVLTQILTLSLDGDTGALRDYIEGATEEFDLLEFSLPRITNKVVTAMMDAALETIDYGSNQYDWTQCQCILDGYACEVGSDEGYDIPSTLIGVTVTITLS